MVFVLIVGVVSSATVEGVPLGVVGDQPEPGHDDGGADGEGRDHHEDLRGFNTKNVQPQVVNVGIRKGCSHRRGRGQGKADYGIL